MPSDQTTELSPEQLEHYARVERLTGLGLPDAWRVAVSSDSDRFYLVAWPMVGLRDLDEEDLKAVSAWCAAQSEDWHQKWDEAHKRLEEKVSQFGGDQLYMAIWHSTHQVLSEALAAAKKRADFAPKQASDAEFEEWQAAFNATFNTAFTNFALDAVPIMSFLEPDFGLSKFLLLSEPWDAVVGPRLGTSRQASGKASSKV